MAYNHAVHQTLKARVFYILLLLEAFCLFNVADSFCRW